jgi:hypothetical protein
MTSLVTRLLGPPEKVEPLACFPTYPRRWMIFETRYFKVYLHHTYNEDLELEFRALPGQSISFGFASSAASSDAVPDRAAWMVLIAKSSRQKEKGD